MIFYHLSCESREATIPDGLDGISPVYRDWICFESLLPKWQVALVTELQAKRAF
ncbi:MAG TPA: hypothetical protein VH796_06715 [Nitrososphaeraceae archaeon]